MTYRIEIDAPEVPYPGGTSHADFMREAADRIKGGYSMGSNLTATVVRLLRVIADEMDRTRPAIEEPKGLGAVVEDEDGLRWVRLDDDPELNKPWRQADMPAVRANWKIVDAVRVLSEGVPS